MDQPLAIRHALAVKFYDESKERKLDCSLHDCEVTIHLSFGIASIVFRPDEVSAQVNGNDDEGWYEAIIDYADPDMFGVIRRSLLDAEDECTPFDA